jgi:outer membrane protein OmpA-like peptidoglycan-associated protein
LDIPVHLRPDFVATISGNLIDRDKKPIEATIKWEDLALQKVVGESKSNPVDGSYFIVLPMGKIYGYYIDKEDYFPISNNIDLRKGDKAIEVKEDIVMPTYEQMKTEDLSVPVNNLFFAVNRTELLSESFPELLRVAGIIKRNNIKVRIAGHTDNTGTPEHNQELSVKRAEAVKAFLIKKGVPDDLIETIGFGFTQPIAPNDTEEGKSKNRRVELKFIN